MEKYQDYDNLLAPDGQFRYLKKLLLLNKKSYMQLTASYIGNIDAILRVCTPWWQFNGIHPLL